MTHPCAFLGRDHSGIEAQLARRKPTFGIGEVIVVSMLTDPFSPVLLQRV